MGTGEISRIDPEEYRQDSEHQEEDKSRIAVRKLWFLRPFIDLMRHLYEPCITDVLYKILAELQDA